MGLFETLTGGFFSPGESKQTSSPTKLDIYTPEQQELLRSLVAQAQAGMGGPSPSSPAMSVGITPEEQAYMDWARGEALGNLASGKPAYDINPGTTQQYFQKSIRPGLEREFRETTLPGVKDAYAGPGYWGSARADAVSDAFTKHGENLGATEAGLIYQDEEARRAALEAAKGRVLPAGEAIGSAGVLSRQIEQEKVMEDLQKFLMGEEVDGKYNPAYNPSIQLAMQLLGFSPWVYGQESEGESTGAGLGYSFMGGVGAGLGQTIGST